jgi:hypothetical protein
LTDWVETEFNVPGPHDRDLFLAGPGDDFLGIGEGPDRAFAGEGDDLVKTDRDGARDVIDCGPGRDRVLYYSPLDPLDVLRRCERLVTGLPSGPPPDA